MQIHVHIHDHRQSTQLLEKILETVINNKHKLNQMAKTTEEVLAELDSISTTVTKIGTETSASLTKIAELQAAVDAAGGVPQSVQDKIDALQTQLQTVDDLVPDAPAPTV